MAVGRIGTCLACLVMGACSVENHYPELPHSTATPGNPLDPAPVPVPDPDPDPLPEPEVPPFSATFLDARGNDGWVEAEVSANAPVAGVDARVNGEAWQELSPTDRASWAAPLFVPTGSIVEFRARSRDGQESHSGKYIWPDAIPLSEGVETPAPDLVVSSERLASSWFLNLEHVSPYACTLYEGCVGGTGWRKLLRFDTEIQNVGTADLVLGDPKTSSRFQFSECHKHYHLDGSTDYTLLTPSRQVATVGHKQAFCWADNVQVSGWDSPQHYPFTQASCTENMGLSAGWGDVYEAKLDCQFIDVTDVPSGEYILQVIVNPQGLLPELDHTNNTAEAIIQLP